jgi:hypothetical protein
VLELFLAGRLKPAIDAELGVSEGTLRQWTQAAGLRRGREQPHSRRRSLGCSGGRTSTALPSISSQAVLPAC